MVEIHWSAFMSLMKTSKWAWMCWKGIVHAARLRDLFAGVKFQDELPANEVLPDDQQDAA